MSLPSGTDGSSPTPIIIPDAHRAPAEPNSGGLLSEQTITLEKGDTLASILDGAGVSRSEAHLAIAALRKKYDLRRLQIRQEVRLTLTADTKGTTLVGLELESRFDRFAGVTRYPDGTFNSYEQLKQWSKLAFRAEGSIKNSLFADGIEAGVPASAMANFLRLFSFDVDFQRDIQEGDRFELVFERYQDSNSRLVHTGDLLFASLTVGGVPRAYYRFGGEDGDDAFYDKNGGGVRKALLRTPVDGARLTSGFGMRRHPISGYTRMHKGVDFAASRGTPIRAAGDGVLTFVGRQRGYGRFVTIQHNGDYTTAYAHMNGFARGLTQGKRVKQGQIIGYVGSSGSATGPHLHYEVRYKGQQVNPQRLRLPSGQKLDGNNLLRFEEQVAAIDLIREGGGTAIAEMPAVKF